MDVTAELRAKYGEDVGPKFERLHDAMETDLIVERGVRRDIAGDLVRGTLLELLQEPEGWPAGDFDVFWHSAFQRLYQRFKDWLRIVHAAVHRDEAAVKHEEAREAAPEPWRRVEIQEAIGIVKSVLEALTEFERRVADCMADELGDPQTAERLELTRKQARAARVRVQRKVRREIASRGLNVDELKSCLKGAWA